MKKLHLTINGVQRVMIVDPQVSLARVLREQFMLTGCKVGCEAGQCGACTIILNGKAVRSCIHKMSRVPDFSVIETIEGIGTPDCLHPLQVAWMAHGCAQCGFCSPGFIMSAKVLLAENPDPTREEVRRWFQIHRNVCRCTGYIPLVDAVMDAAKVLRGEMKKEDLLFKPTDNKIIGTKYARPSALAKVTGTWDYGADVALQMPSNTARLALVQSKIPHGNIKRIDTSEAEKMPGVIKVITHEDVRGKNRISGLVSFPNVNKGDGWDRPILCDDKVFQIGDAIALVAADTVENAKAAADKVVVDIEPLPAYMDAWSAMDEDAIEIHPGTPNVYYETNCIKGDEVDPIFETAAHVAEIHSFCSRQPHLVLEPDCGSAYIDEEGRLTIHSKSIGLHVHKIMIQEGIGIESDKLRLIQNPAGGTFGYKFSPTMEALVGVACLAMDGRPCSLVYDMYQTITYTGKRSPAHMHVKIAADEEGKLLALWGDNYIDHGPYSEFGDLLTMRLSQFTGAGYEIKNIRNRSQTVCTNHIWGSAFRAYGSPQAYMGSEIALDVLAAQMGMDPFDLRYKNIYREGVTTPTGQIPDVYCLEEMYDRAKPYYEEAKKRVAELNAKSDGRYKYGVGFSQGIYGCGLDGADSSIASVRLEPDNTVTVLDSWEDHGQGADIGSLTMAHGTLCEAGFTPEQIKLIKNDTGLTPETGPAGGSRSNVMAGNAIVAGCRMLLDAMKKDDGSYRTYDEMIAEGIPVSYDGSWVVSNCFASDEVTAQGDPFSVYMYELFIPEVQVDMETGKVRVIRFTTVPDVGTIINRTVVDGQIWGGLAQGIGLALTENMEDYEKHITLLGCGIPYIEDIPDEMVIDYVQTPRPLGPYGAAGCGEAPLTAPHPAILNAIHNATGARVTVVPATPDVVKAALDQLA
jgi:aldehyde oxidoreductase